MKRARFGLDEHRAVVADVDVLGRFLVEGRPPPLVPVGDVEGVDLIRSPGLSVYCSVGGRPHPRIVAVDPPAFLAGARVEPEQGQFRAGLSDDDVVLRGEHHTDFEFLSPPFGPLRVHCGQVLAVGTPVVRQVPRTSRPGPNLVVSSP